MDKLNLEMVIEIYINGKKKVTSNENGTLIKIDNIDNTEEKNNGTTI